jgi:hypothetical protein
MKNYLVILEVLKVFFLCGTVILVSHNWDFDVIVKYCGEDQPVIVLEKGD